MRDIGLVTTGRADYGIYNPVLKLIKADPELNLHLIVSGMHLSPEFGLTVRDIEADGYEIGDKIETLLSSDSPEGISKSMGMALIGYSQAFARSQIDLLVVLGDRFEMHAAALAALPFKIPVVHIHGGEITQGAMDDALRHSITKLSHIHFVATHKFADRVIQLGEEPWRVTVTGAPSLDNLQLLDLLDRQVVAEKYGLELVPGPFLLVTFHPVTLEYENTEWQTKELLRALDKVGLPCIFTMPNADTHGRIIRKLIQEYTDSHPKTQAIENLGTQGYFSLMNLASAMVGNSSSGIVEAASFELPVVNIGSRQLGRESGKNVIHVGYQSEEIQGAVQKAIRPGFRSSLSGMENPYGSGYAAVKIVQKLKSIKIDQNLVMKKFYDLEVIS